MEVNIFYVGTSELPQFSPRHFVISSPAVQNLNPGIFVMIQVLRLFYFFLCFYCSFFHIFFIFNAH